jgi:hypothetical protein
MKLLINIGYLLKKCNIDFEFNNIYNMKNRFPIINQDDVNGQRFKTNI